MQAMTLASSALGSGRSRFRAGEDLPAGCALFRGFAARLPSRGFVIAGTSNPVSSRRVACNQTGGITFS